ESEQIFRLVYKDEKLETAQRKQF
ncbi:hypothetical protein HKBW3S06_01447, partial [Candidatus Hakubella thermalkaliphila]